VHLAALDAEHEVRPRLDRLQREEAGITAEVEDALARERPAEDVDRRLDALRYADLLPMAPLRPGVLALEHEVVVPVREARDLLGALMTRILEPGQYATAMLVYGRYSADGDRVREATYASQVKIGERG